MAAPAQHEDEQPRVVERGFIWAERVTIRERRLVAEPFLLVGIIASIKEIVVVAGAERPEDEGLEAFAEAMIEVGALALVILILSISSLLLRRREREPAEEGA